MLTRVTWILVLLWKSELIMPYSILKQPDLTVLDLKGTECGLGTKSEILATPREDYSLEMLAISMTDTITAPQDVYDRLTKDVPAMQDVLENEMDYDYVMNFEGSKINHRPGITGSSLIIHADTITIQRMKNGTFGEWECLASWYKLEHLDELFEGFAIATFNGVYNLKKIAEEFMNLPGVTFAGPDGTLGSGSSVRGKIEGDTWHFVFEAAWGDCFSGCIDSYFFYLTTKPGADPIFHRGRPEWMKYWEEEIVF